MAKMSYKEKTEKGLLIDLTELPFKLGDKAYELYGNKVYFGIISNMTIVKDLDKANEYVAYQADCDFATQKIFGFSFKASDIGTRIFTSREEAEVHIKKAPVVKPIYTVTCGEEGKTVYIFDTREEAEKKMAELNGHSFFAPPFTVYHIEEGTITEE